jgi:hypothetical protein
MQHYPSLSVEARRLLSSRLPANWRNGIFYGDAYNRHTLENAKTFIKSDSERDENGNFIHKAMGEKSRFYDDPEILTMGCSFTEGGALPSMLNWSKIIEQKTKLKFIKFTCQLKTFLQIIINTNEKHSTLNTFCF